MTVCSPTPHVGDCALRLHQRWSLHALCVPPLATEPSRRLLHLFGTVCRSQYGHRRHCKFFAADWRPSFLPGRAVLTKSKRLIALTTTWLHCYSYVLRVTCPCSLRTYATLKFIRSSSSSSSSRPILQLFMNDSPLTRFPDAGFTTLHLAGYDAIIIKWLAV